MSETRLRLLRSVGAMLAGLVAIFVLSIGTDMALHASGIFPPFGQPMADALFLLATAYRIVYGVAGSYVTARLAPDRPMRHALALGIVGPWRSRAPGRAANSGRCSCAHARA
jgi:hypothetical protein